YALGVWSVHTENSHSFLIDTLPHHCIYLVHFQRTFWEKGKPRGMQAPRACIPLEPRQGRSPAPLFPNSSLDFALGQITCGVLRRTVLWLHQSLRRGVEFLSTFQRTSPGTVPDVKWKPAQSMGSIGPDTQEQTDERNPHDC